MHCWPLTRRANVLEEGLLLQSHFIPSNIPSKGIQSVFLKVWLLGSGTSYIVFTLKYGHNCHRRSLWGLPCRLVYVSASSDSLAVHTAAMEYGADIPYCYRQQRVSLDTSPLIFATTVYH